MDKSDFFTYYRYEDLLTQDPRLKNLSVEQLTKKTSLQAQGKRKEKYSLYRTAKLYKSAGRKEIRKHDIDLDGNLVDVIISVPLYYDEDGAVTPEINTFNGEYSPTLVGMMLEDLTDSGKAGFPMPDIVFRKKYGFGHAGIDTIIDIISGHVDSCMRPEIKKVQKTRLWVIRLRYRSEPVAFTFACNDTVTRTGETRPTYTLIQISRALDYEGIISDIKSILPGDGKLVGDICTDFSPAWTQALHSAFPKATIYTDNNVVASEIDTCITLSHNNQKCIYRLNSAKGKLFDIFFLDGYKTNVSRRPKAMAAIMKNLQAAVTDYADLTDMHEEFDRFLSVYTSYTDDIRYGQFFIPSFFANLTYRLHTVVQDFTQQGKPYSLSRFILLCKYYQAQFNKAYNMTKKSKLIDPYVYSLLTVMENPTFKELGNNDGLAFLDELETSALCLGLGMPADEEFVDGPPQLQ